MPDVLGDEWGQLAGLPAEEALKYVARYAADLEDKIDAGDAAQRGGESGGTPSAAGTSDNDVQGDRSVLDKVRDMNRTSKQPLGAEFVGRRETARQQARRRIEQMGYDWNEVSDQVEQVMSSVDPDQQTNPRSWVEAFVWVWGRSEIARRFTEGADDGGDDGGDANTPPRTDSTVRAGNMNTHRGRRQPVDDPSRRYEIDDPIERNTKRQFERVLGMRISDEEWSRLRDESIDTLEDYERLQSELESKRRK